MTVQPMQWFGLSCRRVHLLKDIRKQVIDTQQASAQHVLPTTAPG
jgi:hypothetical protein